LEIEMTFGPKGFVYATGGFCLGLCLFRLIEPARNFPAGNAFALNHTAAGFTMAAAVSKPSTWAMMKLGFCGPGFMTYRRKASTLRAA